MPHWEVSALTVLLAQIAAILVVSRSLGVLMKRIGQPLVIAEVLAGIVLGPSLLGWLWPAAMTGLFPKTSLPSLALLAQVGLVLFMFLIGLELDPKLLRGKTRSSVVISHSSIVVPFLLGAALAVGIYDEYSATSVDFLSFWLFLGVAMSVTAFPVLARILSERNLISSRVGAIAIACAAVDDVTAWCLLSFVVAIARARGVEGALWTTALALVFITFMILVVRPFLGRVGARVGRADALSHTMVALVLFLLVVSASITEIIGIHALFGAFLFGAILPKEGQLAEKLAERLETVAVVLLLPLFFAYSGLRTQIGLVNTPRDWAVTGIIIAIATVGKFGGSTLAGRFTGLRWREASAIGILMNTRGLMELIVLNLGLDLGVLSPTVFTMMVIMALVTTVTTTPILKWVYPDSELLRDREVTGLREVTGVREVTGLREITDAAPAFRVLLCVAEGTSGRGMALIAGALAGWRRRSSELHALHLTRPSTRLSEELRRQASTEEPSPLGPLLEATRELELKVRPLSFVSNDVAADICRTAEAKHASLVLLGLHKPLLFEGHLGGIVSDVVRRSVSPVGVLIDRGLTQVSRILVAYAGGEEDAAALRVARDLGRAPGAQVTLLHVVEPNGEGKGRQQIMQLFPEPELDADSVRLQIVEHESPPDAVLEEAGNGYDLVVLGMSARWGAGRTSLGLRRERVLRGCPVSVLVVHPAEGSRARVDEPVPPVPIKVSRAQ